MLTQSVGSKPALLHDLGQLDLHRFCSGHVAHDDAHNWFSKSGNASWASCPITENGVVRILGNPKYPNSPGSPAVVAGIIEQLRALPGHCFWVEDFSLFGSDAVDASRILTSA